MTRISCLPSRDKGLAGVGWASFICPRGLVGTTFGLCPPYACFASGLSGLGQIKSATSPATIPDMETFTEPGKTVVAIRIGEFPVKPVNTRGQYFKRVASSSHQLAWGEIADLYMQSLQLSWDAHQAGKHSLASMKTTGVIK